MRNRKPSSPNKQAENARKAMLKRSKKNVSDPNMQYYLVIGGFAVVMVAIVVYTVFINPKESFLNKQIIDHDEFIVHNSQNQYFTVGPNQQFEGQTMDEARKLFNMGIADSPNLPSCNAEEPIQLPESYDFRNHEIGSLCQDEPRMTGKCTAGHVLSLLSTIEDRICLANKGAERFRLSAQDAVSCDGTNFQCDGGYVTHTLNYGRDRGFVREECFPWTGTNATCPEEVNECRENKEQYQLLNYCVVQGPEAIKQEIFQNGPVVAPMAPYTDFLTYRDGVYFPSEGSFKFNGQQAVKVVGWQSGVNGDSWIVENVWGTEWGTNGFANVISGHSELGIDFIGIAPRVIPMPLHQWEKEVESYEGQDGVNFDDSDVEDIQV
jgi:cathepsin B